MLGRRIVGALGTCAAISCIVSCGSNVDIPSSTSSAMGGSGGISGSGGQGGDTTSSGSGGAGGSSFCAGGIPIDFGQAIMGDLAMTGQEDFYRFKGKKGQVVQLDIDAQFLADAEYDPTYIDSVVTLFDDLGNQIAQNQDPLGFSTGDSRLDTILPADGEYCARVSECWTSAPNPSQYCDGQKDKTGTKYDLWLYEYVDQSADGETAEVEPDDTPAMANDIEYDFLGTNFYLATFWGSFQPQNDVDVFRFTLPTDVNLPANRRATGEFYFVPDGSYASGSTAKMGRVWVVDSSAPDQILALSDASLYPGFFPRLDLGKPYLLFVERPPSVDGANDFYFVRHSPGRSNPLEMELSMGANDTHDKAEPILVDDATFRGYFEGDIEAAPMDVDHFVATVPMGMTKVWAVCSARIEGSGLRELKISLLGLDGNLLSDTSSATDSPTYAYVDNAPVGNNTQITVRIEADHQEPTIAQAFYRCGMGFKGLAGKL